MTLGLQINKNKVLGYKKDKNIFCIVDYDSSQALNLEGFWIL